MPAAPVTIYDSNMRRVALLENALSIGYETPLNGLWSATFSLPANDPKNAECLPLRFVELYDGRERVELFRILPTIAKRTNDGHTVTYGCEHVAATLLDDVLFQYHTVGNLGVYTTDVLSYVLQRQTVQRWQLGTVGFARQFEYNWENETLRAAILSVPKPFVESYQWTYDTTVYPWRLNLVAASSEVTAYIRYGVNMQGIERTIDPSNVCNRLYALGYGEGVNQLTFRDINGGKAYIEDAASQAQYGIISRVFVDRRYEYAETLLARAQALLDEMKQPRISYTVQASEIHRQTGQDIYRFRTGANIRVQDKEMGVDITARVVNVRKRDMLGAPGFVDIEIANRPIDIAMSLAEISNRQRINEVYAQGATNYDSHDFADNCDPDHPAVLTFWIPEETARINKVRLSYRSEAFRAYSKSIESAPADTSGPSSTSTTASGGQTTSGPSSTTTTSSGGATTSGPSSASTTEGGGGETLSFNDVGFVDFGVVMDSFKSFIVPDGEHNHGDTSWTIPTQNPDHYHVTYNGGRHFHKMYDFQLKLPVHKHDMPHTHDIGPHVHSMPHTHDIGPHVHGMDHTHVIPAHTHGIEYGIFQGPTPSNVTVKVDGNVVPISATSSEDVDIVPYLSKDGSGRIQRGRHEITITPDSLGRIVASVNLQIFVQSRGGGDY